MGFDANAGVSRLAAVIQSQSEKLNLTNPPTVDFGTITGEYSLKTNGFSKPIPRGSYSVCRAVGGFTYPIEGGAHGGHESGDGAHTHVATPTPLMPGDRVLVAWIQNEAVVIDVVKRF